MSTQVFYRKWRPRTLAEVVGQEQVTQTLSNAIATGRISHAYLFYGPRGTGKTSTGRILAKALNCTSPTNRPCNQCQICQAITEGRALDVIEIDAASNRGIDEIRDLREKVNYAPSQARYKVYIVDEVHMLTKEAANALLKTLEEPPPYVVFILATTEIHKVPPTILSRCQRFDFKRIPQAAIVAKLGQICSNEGIEIEPEGLKLIAQSATGSLRDAENLLEQLVTYYGNQIRLGQIQEVLGVTGDKRARELVSYIVNNDTSAGLKTINSVNSDGLDLRQFTREVVEYLRQLLLVKSGSEEALALTPEDIAELKTLAARTSLARIAKALKLFSQLELTFNNYSTLPLELALVDCAQPEVEETPTPPRQHEPPKPQKELRPVPLAKPKIPPKAEPLPAMEPNNELERLRLNWRQLLAEVPQALKRTNAIAILRSADVKPVAIEGDTVILDSKYEFYKEQIERPENLSIAEEIISNFLGRRCHVRCIHKPENNHLVKEALKLGAKVIKMEEK